jgi:hypothetical protein
MRPIKTAPILRHPLRLYHLLVLVLLVYLMNQLCSINSSAHIKSEECQRVCGTLTWPVICSGPHTNLRVPETIVTFYFKSQSVIAVSKNALVASSTNDFHSTVLRATSADLWQEPVDACWLVQKKRNQGNVDSILPEIISRRLLHHVTATQPLWLCASEQSDEWLLLRYSSKHSKLPAGAWKRRNHL